MGGVSEPGGVAAVVGVVGVVVVVGGLMSRLQIKFLWRPEAESRSPRDKILPSMLTRDSGRSCKLPVF